MHFNTLALAKDAFDFYPSTSPVINLPAPPPLLSFARHTFASHSNVSPVISRVPCSCQAMPTGANLTKTAYAPVTSSLYVLCFQHGNADKGFVPVLPASLQRTAHSHLDNVPLQLVVRRDETNCMWSTGNFIKGDFAPALVITLRINIFLASRMDGLQGFPPSPIHLPPPTTFLNKAARANLTVLFLLSRLEKKTAAHMRLVMHHLFSFLWLPPEIRFSVNIPHEVEEKKKKNAFISQVCF